MTRLRWLLALAATAAAVAAGYLLLRPHAATKTASASGYADPQSCIRCHGDEAAGYNKTGMAHAFYAPTANATVTSPAKERVYFHKASSTWFTLTAHDGRFFERRWQKGFDGHDNNIEELSIDYVMGSGNHARTYLHREQDGTLIELPLAWYSENGGEFAMNPGFDNATPMTRRVIAYECMFCHNGYPKVPDTAHRDLSAKPVYDARLPMGIDCQRCHGPGAAHVQAAEVAKPDVQKIQTAILNPASLSNERQMQICEQCHLETTSALLPDRVRHYDQQPFSYAPNQSLTAFNAYFTRDPAQGRTDNVEIVNSAFRLRQSKCYLATHSALTCELCHNPHDLHKGPQNAPFYANICMNCHANQIHTMVAAKKHTDSNQCVSCHMPQQRTSDVVHAAMTDHLIQRLAPSQAKALGPRQEITTRYNGPVARYLLDAEIPRPDDALYNAVAQVIDSSNNAAGAAQLEKVLDEQKPREPNFYIELGDAERHNNHIDAAISAYRKAMELDPLSSRGARRLGVTLGTQGQTSEAMQVLGQAIGREPDDEILLYERAQIEVRTGDTTNAITDLHKALSIKPDYADALNNLGSLLAQSGETEEAETDLRQALAVNPYDADARANLGRLLNAKGEAAEAAFQFERATQLDPANPEPYLDYAILLLRTNQVAHAEMETHTALQLKPDSARGLDLSGQLALIRGRTAQALALFEAAAKADPSFSPAQLDVGETYLEMGDMRSALPWLKRAQQSAVPAVAQRAAQLLSKAPAN